MEQPVVPKQLLLVEDNPHDILLVRHLLERYAPGEWAVSAVHSVDEAHRVLATHQPPMDLVLLDVGLGKTTGTLTITQMMGPAPQAAVALFTSNADSQLQQAGVAFGIIGYIDKQVMIDAPASFASLLQRVCQDYAAAQGGTPPDG